MTVGRITSRGFVVTWVKRIGALLKGAPSRVAAGFTYKQHVYLVQEEEAGESSTKFYKARLSATGNYLASGFSVTSGNPFSAANGFAGVGEPSGIDGAFSWPGYYTMMFSGKQYYQASWYSEKVCHVAVIIIIVVAAVRGNNWEIIY